MFFGQGRPLLPLAVRLVALGLLCAGSVAPAITLGDPPSIGLRIEWGGGSQRRWEGVIGLSRGQLAQPRPLGVEADEPGSMWFKDGSLVVRQRSARTYDGVDLTVTGGLDEHLLVQLTPAGQRESEVLRFRLGDLLGDFRSEALDDQGNRVLVRRSPGDRLRVSVKDRSLVYLPGDVFRIEVTPELLPVPPETKLRLNVQILPGRQTSVLWQTDLTAKAGEGLPIAVNVPLPNQEGVYDVLISALHAGWQQAVRMPLGGKPIAERRIQVLVLSPGASAAVTSGELSAVDEIEPASPRRWEERLAKLPQLPQLPQLPVLPRWRKGPLGNGRMQIKSHALGSLVQLERSRSPNDASWEAYTLVVSRPGLPHVLEVDYPSDVPQTLSISVLEANAAGGLGMGVDSGVDVPEPIYRETGAPRWLRHRLVFWPRTRSPLVLLSNRSLDRPAVYGKIRVLGGWERLPRAYPAEAEQPQRMLAAYMDRPLFPENFSASETLDAWIGRSLDDWQTFYEGGLRLTEYLQYAGYDSLMISVLAEGSTIYPSGLLEPTPRYDTGLFFDSGQDPVRKDGLEMLLRMFDRERLRLIPTLDFSAPLPRLEETLRRGGAASASVRWIGPAGTPWDESLAGRRTIGPYYNVLDPRVQEEMLSVVREVVRGYGQHPSFAALALKLSADGYAQLPGPEWGLDDATIDRFQRDCRMQVPGEGPQRFAQRSQFFAGDPARRVWLQWRADQLYHFYRRVHEELIAVRPGCRLYLAGAEILSSPEMQSQLRPTLPRRTTLGECLIWSGIDPRHYQQDDSVVLLRPEQIAPLGRLGAEAVNIEIHQMPDADRLFQEMAGRGSLFFHPPEKFTLPSFDEKSPFRPSYTEFLSQVVPSGRENRRRILHALAAGDATTVADGGWLLPLGQEDELRDLIDAYRRLPPVRLQTAADEDGRLSKSVIARFGSHAGRSWAYLVNDAPFPATVQLAVDASPRCRMEELTGRRKIAPPEIGPQGTVWRVSLEPYDLVAVSFSEPGVRLLRPAISSPSSVAAELSEQVRALSTRAAILGSLAPLPAPKNPGFEGDEEGDGLSGWTANAPAGTAARLDSADKHAGRQSLHLTSSGPALRMLSEAFDPPATGRLSVSVWMRVKDERAQPPLQLAIEGKLDGADYSRFAVVGQSPPGTPPAPPIAASWANYLFQVEDLPLEGLAQVRVRFDLAGPGEVWIDDVQVFHLAFNRKERLELSKIIALADVKLQNGQLGDCLRLLEGYWPRFLQVHVPLPDNLVQAADPPGAGSRAANRRQTRTAEAPQERSGLLDRFKGMLPRQLRF